MCGSYVVSIFCLLLICIQYTVLWLEFYCYIVSIQFVSCQYRVVFRYYIDSIQILYIQAEYSQHTASICSIYIRYTINIGQYPDIMQSVYSFSISNKSSVYRLDMVGNLLLYDQYTINILLVWSSIQTLCSHYTDLLCNKYPFNIQSI